VTQTTPLKATAREEAFGSFCHKAKNFFRSCCEAILFNPTKSGKSDERSDFVLILKPTAEALERLSFRRQTQCIFAT
jgi:hypothetical protein